MAVLTPKTCLALILKMNKNKFFNLSLTSILLFFNIYFLEEKIIYTFKNYLR